jgi:hypothetical protein
MTVGVLRTPNQEYSTDMLQRLWNWLTSSGSRKPRKAHPDLYPIDVDRIAKELRLIEEAKRLGAGGLPAPKAKSVSGPEAAVIQRVEKARQDYVDWGALRLNVLNTDLSRRDITKDVNRARQADQEFERNASARLTEQEAIVRGLGEVARKRKAELETFRAKHQLTREAHFPTGSGTFLRYAILAALIVIEAVLNAQFFAKGLDSGLLGGFTEAAIMAAINVLIAFLIGKFAIPYVNHASAIPKMLGLLAMAASLAGMCCIGMCIAHYRDSLTAEIANPAKVALEAFLSHPFQLKDVFSWALFVVSVIFGLGSLLDGLYSDDSYPSYGAISRRTQSAIDDHETELNLLRAELEGLKNEALEGLDAALKRAQADVAVLESLIQDKQMAGSRLSTALLDAGNSLDALLKKFRTENELHRNGMRPPSYFDSQPDLKPVRVPDFDTTLEESALHEQRNLVSTLLSEEQDIRARIQAAFTQQFDRLKPLDSHFPSKEAA